MDRRLRELERSGDFRALAHALRRAGRQREAFDTLTSGLDAEIKTARTALGALRRAATEAGEARYEAAGGCLKCKGAGRVKPAYQCWSTGADWRMNDPYPCPEDHAPNFRDVDEGLLHQRLEEELATIESAQRALDTLEAERAQLREVKVTKGARVIYSNKRARAKFARDAGELAGSKVPLGTEGEAFWVGAGNYGERVGVRTDDGATFWTALANVTLADPFYALEDAADFRALLRRFPRGTEVVADGRVGELFWVRTEDGRCGVRPHDSTGREDVVWTNLSDLELAQPAGA